MSGTPKTLKDAVIFGLSYALKDADKVISASVRDFLAQRFGAAMLNKPESAEDLRKLFNEITGEELV